MDETARESKRQILERPRVTEEEVTQKLYQVARNKSETEELNDDKTRSDAIAERVAIWRSDKRLPTFEYKSNTKDPNVGIATMRVNGREAGELIVYHYPLGKKQSMVDSFRAFFHKPRLKFREIYQFINNNKRTLLLEEADGTIPTDAHHPVAVWDSFLPEYDIFTTTDLYVRDFFGLISKLHEQGHAYRFGLMADDERRTFIVDHMITFLPSKQKDAQRQTRVIIEEAGASAAAIIRVNKVLEFLGISNEELPTDLIIDLCAEGILSRL